MYACPDTVSERNTGEKFGLTAISNISAAPLHVNVGVSDTFVELSAGAISVGRVTVTGLLPEGESHPFARKNNDAETNKIIAMYFIKF